MEIAALQELLRGEEFWGEIGAFRGILGEGVWRWGVSAPSLPPQRHGRARSTARRPPVLPPSP